ncbi:MAG: PEPxxWA-CTERM sorting domain-containing protein [Thermaurantiacus sp.]
MHHFLAYSIIAATAAAALVAAPASANGALSAGSGAASASGGAAPLTTVETSFDVSGIFSNDGIGAAINERRSVLLAPNATLVGIGWDVLLFADSPSWLSEMIVSFGSTSAEYVVFLRPGVGDNFPGTQFYSSGGIIDLIGLGLDFTVDADGLLRLEFFEDFVDYPGDWDGIWQQGTLSLRYTFDGGGVIPEPMTWAMMIAGFGVVGGALRRRRQTVTA